jgi:hypothetical protein
VGCSDDYPVARRFRLICDRRGFVVAVARSKLFAISVNRPGSRAQCVGGLTNDADLKNN